MRLGALLVPDDGADPRSIADQAIEIEAAGYEGIGSAQAMSRGFMLFTPNLVALSLRLLYWLDLDQYTYCSPHRKLRKIT